jgi:uncharacterized membrane protein
VRGTGPLAGRQIVDVLTDSDERAATRAWRMAMAVCAVAMAAFTGTFTTLGLRQFWRFHVHAFDLGIFAQGTWLLSRFRDPFVTIRGLTLFADHSSYILVLIVPLTWLFPTAETLIVVGILALVATAPAAFAIARHVGAGPVLSAVTAVSVLVQPALQWNVLDPFHPEVLVIPLAVAAIALLQRDRDGWAIAAITLALTAKEDVGLLVVPLGLVVAWRMGKRRTGLIIAGLGVVAFLVNFLILLPAWSPTGELLYGYRYASLGDGPIGIVVGLLTKYHLWWEVVTDPQRVGYVAALVCAMPLCVLAPRWLLLGGPTLLANLFTSHGYQYDVRYHYTAYLVVAVVVAAAHGAGRVGSWGRPSAVRVSVAVMALAAIGTWIVTGPAHGWAPSDSDEDRISAIVDIVPEGASVSAWTTLAPHFTDRDLIYLFPNPWLEYDYGLQGPYGVEGSDAPDPDDVDWVFVRLDSYRTFDPVIDELMSSGDFVLAVEDRPFLLLRRIR